MNFDIFVNLISFILIIFILLGLLINLITFVCFCLLSLLNVSFRLSTLRFASNDASICLDAPQGLFEDLTKVTSEMLLICSSLLVGTQQILVVALSAH